VMVWSKPVELIPYWNQDLLNILRCLTNGIWNSFTSQNEATNLPTSIIWFFECYEHLGTWLVSLRNAKNILWNLDFICLLAWHGLWCLHLCCSIIHKLYIIFLDRLRTISY
jgi:hypothetical protein